MHSIHRPGGARCWGLPQTMASVIARMHQVSRWPGASREALRAEPARTPGRGYKTLRRRSAARGAPRGLALDSHEHTIPIQPRIVFVRVCRAIARGG